MAACFELIDGGLGNSIQDAGRFGFRHMGIAVSGALDSVLLRCANALVGNEATAAAIEIRALGPTLELRRGRARVALAGDIAARLKRADGSALDVPAWASVTMEKQDVLEVAAVQGGVAYLALTGGVESPVQLGSRSTYPRAQIGGIEGKLLATGMLLPCGELAHLEHREYSATAWQHDTGPVRVIPGPQAGHFTPEALVALTVSDYQVTPQMDRMGVRLEGAALAHVSPEAADIVSDGVTPGAMQVPGNGQPIVLLADCQTVGGYPKIATVISADLPRLAHWKAGQTVRFEVVDMAQARAARAAGEARFVEWAAQLSFEVKDARALLSDLSSAWNESW